MIIANRFLYTKMFDNGIVDLVKKYSVNNIKLTDLAIIRGCCWRENTLCIVAKEYSNSIILN